MEEGHFFAKKCPFFRLEMLFLPPVGGIIDFIDKLKSPFLVMFEEGGYFS